ncbi:hypothetical protein N9H93_02950 [Rhizobiaceae bacterium]|nr:hypothetical protein [Rhizobiaceae bacterium]
MTGVEGNAVRGHDAIVRSLLNKDASTAPDRTIAEPPSSDLRNRLQAALPDAVTVTLRASEGVPEGELWLVRTRDGAGFLAIDEAALGTLCDVAFGGPRVAPPRGRVAQMVLKRFAVTMLGAALEGDEECACDEPTLAVLPDAARCTLSTFEMLDVKGVSLGAMAIAVPLQATRDTLTSSADRIALPARFVLAGPVLTLASVQLLHVGQVLEVDARAAAIELDGRTVRTGDLTRLGPHRALAIHQNKPAKVERP